MSLAMVLANQYGIVMSADKRMTLAPKTSDGQTFLYPSLKYSLQGTTQGRYLTGGVPPVRFSM